MATNPKAIRGSFSIADDMLEVVIERDITDSLTGRTERREDTVRGPLSDLGLATFRSKLVAWVKAQTGYAGTIDGNGA